MTVLDLPDGYLIRFHTGEEVVSGLTAFARSAGITAAWVNALGAVSEAELGYFDGEERQYVRQPFHGEMEVLALVGNISRVEGEPFAHLHATLGRRDFTTLGGHLFRGVAGATIEMFVRNYAGTTLVRARDEAVGLNLWALPGSYRPEG